MASYYDHDKKKNQKNRGKKVKVSTSTLLLGTFFLVNADLINASTPVIQTDLITSQNTNLNIAQDSIDRTYQLKGHVQIDSNNDGKNDSPLVGTRVVLINNEGNAVETVTNESGFYHFTQLARGNYILKFYVPMATNDDYRTVESVHSITLDKSKISHFNLRIIPQELPMTEEQTTEEPTTEEPTTEEPTTEEPTTEEPTTEESTTEEPTTEEPTTEESTTEESTIEEPTTEEPTTEELTTESALIVYPSIVKMSDRQSPFVFPTQLPATNKTAEAIILPNDPQNDNVIHSVVFKNSRTKNFSSKKVTKEMTEDNQVYPSEEHVENFNNSKKQDKKRRLQIADNPTVATVPGSIDGNLHGLPTFISGFGGSLLSLQ